MQSIRGIELRLLLAGTPRKEQTMKLHAPLMDTFLTEGERRIAEEVRRLRDLNARDSVIAGNAHHQKSGKIQLSAHRNSRSQVKDSHDR